jgi:diguanylate cyclase (GGDEF)-like protein
MVSNDKDLSAEVFNMDNIINDLNDLNDIEITDILNSMDEAVIITTKDNKMIFYNNSAPINLKTNLDVYSGKDIRNIPYFKALFSDDTIIPSYINDLASGYKVTNIFEIDGEKHYFENERISIYDHKGVDRGTLYLTRDISKEIKLEHKLNMLVKTDDLSGLFNSRYFYEEIEKEIARCSRYDCYLSLLFIDIDNFKLFNDKFGHKAGDEIIRITGQILKDSVRQKIDTAYRYGGDEFVLIFPNTTAKRSTIMANRIISAFNNEFSNKMKTILFDNSNDRFKELSSYDSNSYFNIDKFYEGKKITLSIGVSEYKNGKKAEDLIKEADNAMYEAKKTEHCKVCIYEA